MRFYKLSTKISWRKNVFSFLSFFPITSLYPVLLLTMISISDNYMISHMNALKECYSPYMMRGKSSSLVLRINFLWGHSWPLSHFSLGHFIFHWDFMVRNIRKGAEFWGSSGPQWQAERANGAMPHSMHNTEYSKNRALFQTASVPLWLTYSYK